VLLSSPVSEAGDGLVLCDLEGRRVSGKRTIGAGDGWVGAELRARDVGTKPVSKQDIYLAVDWLERAEVWAIGPNWLGKKIFTYTFPRRADWDVGGLAVRDGRIALSLPKLNQALLIDAEKGTLRGKTEVEQPRGLAFDAAGRLRGRYVPPHPLKSQFQFLWRPRDKDEPVVRKGRRIVFPGGRRTVASGLQPYPSQPVARRDRLERDDLEPVQGPNLVATCRFLLHYLPLR
jgi:hypothetical protein